MSEEQVGQPMQEFEGVVPPQLPKLKTHDEFGLSLDPKHWAKNSCKTCWGQGIFVQTSTIKAAEMVQGAAGSGNQIRMTEPCHCSMRAYWRIRGPLQNRVIKVWETQELTEEKRMETIMAIVGETLKQVRNTGTATDVKAMVKAADESLKSQIVRPTGSDVRRVNQKRR